MDLPESYKISPTTKVLSIISIFVLLQLRPLPEVFPLLWFPSCLLSYFSIPTLSIIFT